MSEAGRRLACCSLLVLLAGWLLRLRDCDVDGMSGTPPQIIEGRLDFGSVTYNEHGQLVGMNVLFGSNVDFSKRDLFQGCFIGLQIVGWVSVELEANAFGEDLFAGVVTEQE